jgi:hypothetical protein
VWKGVWRKEEKRRKGGGREERLKGAGIVSIKLARRPPHELQAGGAVRLITYEKFPNLEGSRPALTCRYLDVSMSRCLDIQIPPYLKAQIHRPC